MAKKTTPANRLSNFTIESIPASKNRYCGPAAMSAITGKDPDHCAEILAKVINRTRCLYVNRTAAGVTSTYVREVAVALNELGYAISMENAQPYEVESFKKWATRTEEERGGDVFLVLAGAHWRVVHKWQTVCGIKRTPHHTNSATRPGSKVFAAWKVTSLKG